LSVTIQLRGGTAAEWTAANPVLAEREMGVETDTFSYKIGDGTTAWNALPYGWLRTHDIATEATLVQLHETAQATAALQSEISNKLPPTLGQQTVANSVSVTPATAAAFRAGAPLVASTSVRTVQTNATGSNWAAFASHTCSALDILNQVVTSPNAAVDLRVRLNGAGEWFPLRAGGSYMVTGITNANQVEIQRSDQSNTQVEVRAVAYAA
jgi:hypothetical protein